MKLSTLKILPNAHEDGIWAAAWAPETDGRSSLLLTGSVDEKVNVWSGDGLALQRMGAGHHQAVVALAVNPVANVAASSALDCSVRVFDVDSNATRALIELPTQEVWQLAFSPDGQMLAVACGTANCVKLYSCDTWQPIDGARLQVPLSAGGASEVGLSASKAEKQSTGKFVLAVAWSPDGRHIACSTMDGTVALFDVASLRMITTLEGHNLPVRSLKFSPVEPRLLFTASDDMHVHMYDVESRQLISAMSGHSSWILSVDCSPDGTALATGSSDQSVCLWDLTMRSCVQQMRDHRDQVWAVAFRPPGQGNARGGGGRLASVSDDKTIALYDFA